MEHYARPKSRAGLFERNEGGRRRAGKKPDAYVKRVVAFVRLAKQTGRRPGRFQRCGRFGCDLGCDGSVGGCETDGGCEAGRPALSGKAIAAGDRGQPPPQGAALFIGLRLEKPCQKRSPLRRRQFGQGAEALAKPVRRSL